MLLRSAPDFTALQVRTEEGFRPDDFAHEQNLLIQAGGKAVLICGCAHRGVVNIRDRAAELLGRMPDAVIGGFHFFELTPGPDADRLTGLRTLRKPTRTKPVSSTRQSMVELSPLMMIRSLSGQCLRK